MRSVLKLTTAAAALAGSALFCAPANAAYVGVGVGPIGFDVYSGGYCDRWGCPDNYWTYPIYYGPVYYNSAWYRGPVYTRTVNGERWYWVRGGWRRDQWRGARPGWARYTHYGPALGLDYYRARGFRVSDENWRAWADRDDRYRAGYRDNDQGGTYGNEDRTRYRDYDMDRDQYRGHDRGYDRDMDQERGDQERGYGPDYDRDRGTYEHSGYDRNEYGRGNENGPDYDRDRGTDNSGYDRDRDTNGSDRDRGTPGYDRDRDQGSAGSDRGGSGYDRDRNGYEHSGYERDRDRGTYERSNYSGGASGTGHSSHTIRHTHATHGTTHHHTMNAPSDRDRGYMHTRYRPDQDRDRMRGDVDRNDMDRTRSDDRSRDHGNSGPSNQNPDQDHSENDSGYKHTSYERPGSYGHAKGPPPSNAHNSTRSHPNPDDGNNGPSD